MKTFSMEGLTLRVGEEGFSFRAEDTEIFFLHPGTAVNTEKEDWEDEDLRYTETEADGVFRAVWETASHLWERKEYILEADKFSARYSVRVTGKGKIRDVRYFSRGGNRYEAAGYYTPISPFDGVEVRHHSVTEPFSLGLGYMCPPPLCYSFFTDGIETKLGAALAAQPGEYDFDSFTWENQGGRIGFGTDYHGYKEVDGSFTAATMLFFSGASDEDVLKRYRVLCFLYGYAGRRRGGSAEWWKGPLFCGWGEQGCLAEGTGRPAKDFAVQIAYEDMSRELDARRIPVSAIIIDDKWQKAYGTAVPNTTRWPELRRFADEEHRKGRKVLLWFKVWNGEGLPEDEQVLCLCRPVGADPTNPKYRARVREMMHRLLSDDEGCFGCDGFKLDFANCMPLGDELSTYEPGVYGIELLHRMFELLYTEAKRVKPDALMNNSCCNPYFAAVTDQVRLHDYYGAARSGASTVENRAGIYRAVMEGILIDTDGAGGGSRRDTMRYIRRAAELGVPDLYSLHTPCLTHADWEEIGEIYRAYAEKIRKGG